MQILGDSFEAQKVEALSAVPTLHLEADPLLIQFPTNVSDKTAEDDSSN